MSLWLAKDQRSNEVVALQNALNIRLKPPKLLVLDGIFGPLTEGAVKEFQTCEGLKADGIAGPHTLGKLFVRRTVVHEFVLSSDPLSGGQKSGAGASDAGPRVGRSPSGQPKVGSPWDRPSLPPQDATSPSFEERWRAYKASRPPKPPPPDVPPVPPAPSLEQTAGEKHPEPPPPRVPDGHPRQKHVFTCAHPEKHTVVGPNECWEFESATDIVALMKERPFEFSVSQSFTVAMVKAKPYVVPSGSLYFGSSGSGLQFSLRFWDTPIYAHQWKNMAGEANSIGRLSIGPSLVGSLRWDYLRKQTEVAFLGGLRVEGSWTKAWESRRGRERSLTMFFGLAAHAVFLSESEDGLKGLSKPEPRGFETSLQAGFKFGPWGAVHH